MSSESVEYIEARNDLSKKVRRIRRMSPADDPVRRAEAALKILSAHFDDWMFDGIRAIGQARDAWAAARYEDGDEKRAFYRSVHDLKGQATTLGYPLATQIATSLCALVERVADRHLLPIELIDSHVDALKAVVRENARNPADRIGFELAQRLGDLAGAYIAKHGRPDAADDGVIVREL